MAVGDPRLNVVMPADLYKRFRHALVDLDRTNMSEAICEAVEAWLDQHEKEG